MTTTASQPTKTMKWDERFLRMAALVSQWSKDPSTRCGSVIVASDHRVVSTGYNGFPRSMADSPEHLADREEKYSRVVHAEINALLFAREPVEGMTCYTWPFMSCDRCAVQLAQAGITRFCAPAPFGPSGERWRERLLQTKRLLGDMGIAYVEYELARSMDADTEMLAFRLKA